MKARILLPITILLIFKAFSLDLAAWQRDPLSTETKQCHLYSEADLVQRGCKISNSLSPAPLLTVQSYKDFDYDHWLAASEKNWNLGEIKNRQKAFSQICRTISHPTNKLVNLSCEPRLIPRGSVVSVLREETDSAKTTYLVRVMSVSQKYMGLSAATSKALIAAGDYGYIEAATLKNTDPSTLYLVMKGEQNETASLMLDLQDKGYTYSSCDDRFLVGFKELDAKKYQLKTIDSSSKKYLDLDCAFKEKNLEIAPSGPRAYKLLTLINKTFKSEPYNVFDLLWSEEYLVAFPYSTQPYESDPDKIQATAELFHSVPDFEGYGPENRYATFNDHVGMEFLQKIDRWVRPRSMCSFFKIMEKWMETCPDHHSAQFCALQINDFSFHSPAITPASRNPRGVPLDVLGHRTHNSARCIDLRLLSPDHFVRGFENSNESKAMVNEFLTVVHQMGAVDMFYSWPDATTNSFVRNMPHHDNHVHFCFPTKAERAQGYFQSISPDSGGETKANIENVRLKDKEAEATAADPFYTNCPVLPLLQAPETEACYAEDIDFI